MNLLLKLCYHMAHLLPVLSSKHVLVDILPLRQVDPQSLQTH